MNEDDYTNATYTLDVNDRRYALTNTFREAIEERARLAYEDNPRFSCWWQVSDGDPILVIETMGTTVPWDRLDQLEVGMEPPDMHVERGDEPDEREDIDEGNGMKTVPPEDAEPDESIERIDIGRTHFPITPHRYEEVPTPRSDDPEKLPPKRDEIDGNELVKWVPNDPDLTHTWATGEAMTAVDSWVEWNVQLRADQPRGDSPDSHDSFESLCHLYDCPVVGELTAVQDIPEDAGSVQRKGKEAFEDGRFNGDNWEI